MCTGWALVQIHKRFLKFRCHTETYHEHNTRFGSKRLVWCSSSVVRDALSLSHYILCWLSRKWGSNKLHKSCSLSCVHNTQFPFATRSHSLGGYFFSLNILNARSPIPPSNVCTPFIVNGFLWLRTVCGRYTKYKAKWCTNKAEREREIERVGTYITCYLYM